jgi:hypothetical protein
MTKSTIATPAPLEKEVSAVSACQSTVARFLSCLIGSKELPVPQFRQKMHQPGCSFNKRDRHFHPFPSAWAVSSCRAGSSANQQSRPKYFSIL